MFEHTEIEPIERYIENERKWRCHVGLVCNRVAGLLPATEHFELTIPLAATLNMKSRQLQRMQDRLVEWIIAVAPTLPVAQPGRYIIPRTLTALLPEIRFEVSLARQASGRRLGELSIVHGVGNGWEEDAAARLARAYESKVKKLTTFAKYEPEYRSVLILESNDTFLTNVVEIARNVSIIEEKALDKPDEVYFFDTKSELMWWLWTLRTDEATYYSMAQSSERYKEFDPDTLIDLTRR